MELVILTTKERLKEAENLFTDLMRIKEERGYQNISHRYSNRDGKINRDYYFENNKGNGATLRLMTEPNFTSLFDIKWFDNVISFDVNADKICDNYLYM